MELIPQFTGRIIKYHYDTKSMLLLIYFSFSCTEPGHSFAFGSNGPETRGSYCTWEGDWIYDTPGECIGNLSI